MNEVPRRIDPATDRETAALILGCSPNQVGYCPRCHGLTQHYGIGAQAICRARHAAEVAGDSRVGRGGSFFRGSRQADVSVFCTVRNPTPYFR